MKKIFLRSSGVLNALAKAESIRPLFQLLSKLLVTHLRQPRQRTKGQAHSPMPRHARDLSDPSGHRHPATPGPDTSREYCILPASSPKLSNIDFAT